MKKTLFFVVIVLALFCFISCDHLSSVKYDVSGSNPVDSLNGKITSDGTSISLVLPAFPGAASRDADPAVNEKQHFHVTLIAEPDFIDSKEGCAGETVKFEKLTPGDYTLKCKAWDDDSGLHFEGEQPVTVKEGSNETSLVMNFMTEDDHIKLEPTENGVTITIKGIDFSKINGVSVYEYSSGTRFFLDESKKAEITAGGKDTYTFIWPFAPSKINGKKCNYYVFRCETVNTDNTVKEEIVCCDKKDTLTSIDFTNFDKIKMKYEENGNERNVYFDNISLNTLRWTVTNTVAASRIEKFRAVMELWAYDSGKKEFEWIDTNVIDLPVSGNFIPGANDDFEQNCDNLFKGNKVNFLDFAGADADTVNTTLTEYGKVIPNFIWRFTMTDIPYGCFELHPINGQFPYTPITPVTPVPENLQAVDITNGPTENILMDNGKPVLTVEKKDGIFSLVVNVPQNTTYMQIEESQTGNSYHFTKKQGAEGILICSGQEVTIPWAFRADAGEYEFLIKFTASYGYREGSARVSSDSVTGADFEYNHGSYKGAPVLHQDVIINSNSAPFTLKMPGGRTVGTYSLPATTQSYTIEDPTVVYSLCFLNDAYDTYDIRLRVTDPEIQGVSEIDVWGIVDNTTKYPLYFCNNDEDQENGFALYKAYQASQVDIPGIYNKTGLYGQPRMYTTGGLAFRLHDAEGKYIDSGETSKVYGEYRLPLWSHEWEYYGEYPNPN